MMWKVVDTLGLLFSVQSIGLFIFVGSFLPCIAWVGCAVRLMVVCINRVVFRDIPIIVLLSALALFITTHCVLRVAFQHVLAAQRSTAVIDAHAAGPYH